MEGDMKQRAEETGDRWPREPQMSLRGALRGAACQQQQQHPTLSVLSSEPDTTVLPSGEKATERT